jgi:hypothetical protein
MNDIDLGFQPRPARHDLAYQRLLMQAPFTALDEFEMFHRVSDIDLRARNARRSERFIKETTRRPNKRTPLSIFHVTGLFTDKHQARLILPLAEYCLGSVAIEIATFTRPGRNA